MPERGPFPYDVFLSHNAQDKPRVRWLAERLRAAGLRVWFDEWAIQPGDDIDLAIERGLAAARVLVLCVSPAALGSEWGTLERSTVLFRDPTNAGRRFILLLLDDCELQGTLRRCKYVDFRQDSDAALEALIVACRGPADTVPAVAPSPPAQTSRGTRRTRLSGSKRAKPRPVAPPRPQEQSREEMAPLAVLERQLTGHTSWVNSVAVSPDGTWVVSGADDKTIKMWDLASEICRATLDGRTDRVGAVAITPDGRRILSGSFDCSIRVWDVRERKQVAILKLDSPGVPLCPLPDNQRVFIGLSRPKNCVELWSFDPVRRVWGRRTTDYAQCVAIDKVAERAVSGHQHGTLQLWNLETGASLATMKGHSDTVNSIQITPDGRLAVSGSNDKTVKIWDLETRCCIGTLEGHQNKVHAVAISPNGFVIASTGFQDKTVRLWDRQSGACVQVIKNEESASPIAVAFSPDGSRLVVGTTRGTIYVYRLPSLRPTPPVEATRRYMNAKVVLIGEGTVGKTSLAHRLVEDRYVVRDRTHGMNVWRLDLPLPPDATLEREALLWDLAGQEDYRLIHQLFLEETALALLLINPQKDDPFAEAGDWLKALKTAAQNHEAHRDAARLLIFSQIDVGGMKLSNAKIERFRQQYGFAGWLPTSAKTGEHCSDQANGGQPSTLKQLIAASIPWDTLPWTSTPRLLATLKNAVMTMRDASDIRLLRFAELARRLEQALPGEQFGESEVRTAVTLLANHGLARPLKFGDLVLLRPDLLNGYAGAIIRAARAHVDEIGCVLEADIYQADFDFTGVERLQHRPDEELLLRALVQTLLDNSLCIAEDTPQGRHLVFPSQYRREKDMPHEPDIFVSYTFSGEWQTVWTTLVVRLWYSQEFQQRELWRNAAEFDTSKRHTLGLKIANRQGEGEATIALFFDVNVPDELRVIFIEYVHRHLAKYAVDVRRDRRYICECGKPVIDLDAVRARLQAQRDFIYCQQCDAQVPLLDFIEQRLQSDPVAQKILAMEATASRALDAQALEQILIGHMMAICGEANQIFRPVTMFDHGIDGEVEFKNNNGQASGKKIYVQLKSGNSYLRTRIRDGREVFDVKDPRHLDYWRSQPVDVYLVIRQTDELRGDATIRWMNLTRYLQQRKNKTSRQIVFTGEALDAPAIWRARDAFFGATRKERP